MVASEEQADESDGRVESEAALGLSRSGSGLDRREKEKQVRLVCAMKSEVYLPNNKEQGTLSQRGLVACVNWFGFRRKLLKHDSACRLGPNK